MRSFGTVSVIGVAVLLAGCSTITTGTDEMVTIETDPAGAVCKLSTGGKQVAVVNPTPGSVEVPKSRKDLTVRCEREEYLPTEGTIRSSFQGMTLGNAIFGGLIGVAIDAGSGAMNKYEDGVKIALIPETFESAEAKETFFDNLRDRTVADHEAAAAARQNRCGDPSNCEQELKKAEKERDARLAEVERLRGEAKVAAPQPSTS